MGKGIKNVKAGYVCSFLSFVCLLLLLGVTDVYAAPANDDFINAQVLTGSEGSVSGTNVDATAETGEDDLVSYSAPLNSVWYSWTAPSSESMKFRAEASEFYPMMGVYTGTSVDSLTEITNNWDSNGEFTPTVGQTYYIVVDGYSSYTGSFTLNYNTTVLLSGSVSLPNGAVNSVDMDVEIQAYNVNTWEELAYQYVTIPAGVNSADFTMALEAGHQAKLYYSWVDYADDTYVTPGYYSSEGTTTEYYYATTFSTDTPPYIDLELIKGVIFSGDVILPDGDTFQEEVSLYVDAITSDGYHLGGIYTFITEGSNSVYWEITVPANSGDIVLKATIETYYFDPGPPYLGASFYNSLGTVGIFENAELLSTDIDHERISFELLKGNIVDGTISLPSPDTFADNSYIRIYANWGTGLIGSSEYYSVGDSSIDYALAVPPDAPDYRLEYYWRSAGDSYLSRGYYYDGQIVPCEGDAEIFTPGVDYPLTHFELAKQYVATGAVSLPDGSTLTEDLPVELGALYVPADDQYDTTLKVLKNVTIPAYENSIDYTLQLPATCEDIPGEYQVRYRQTNNNYVRYGYYNPAGTTGTIKNAFELTANSNHSEIDLSLMDGNVFTGTITLPGGENAPEEGLEVTLGTVAGPVGLYHTSVTGFYHTTVTVDPGLSSVSYSIRVAPDYGDFAIGYDLGAGSTYARKGYFSTSVTSGDNVAGCFNNGDVLNPLTPAGGNDFTLGYGQEVSGTVYLPSPATGEIQILVQLAIDPDDPGSVYWQEGVFIPDTGSSGSYSSRVILDSDVFAKFINSSEPLWHSHGYYYDSVSSVARINQATWLTAWSDHLPVDLFLFDALSPGDLNSDGSVDLVDMILGLKILSGESIDEDIPSSADTDGDGKIAIPDVIYILNQP